MFNSYQDFPKLMDTLTNIFTKEFAIQLVEELIEDDSAIVDSHMVSCAFFWHKSRRPTSFWTHVSVVTSGECYN